MQTIFHQPMAPYSAGKAGLGQCCWADVTAIFTRCLAFFLPPISECYTNIGFALDFICPCTRLFSVAKAFTIRIADCLSSRLYEPQRRLPSIAISCPWDNSTTDFIQPMKQRWNGSLSPRDIIRAMVSCTGRSFWNEPLPVKHLKCNSPKSSFFSLPLAPATDAQATRNKISENKCTILVDWRGASNSPKMVQMPLLGAGGWLARCSSICKLLFTYRDNSDIWWVSYLLRIPVLIHSTEGTIV